MYPQFEVFLRSVRSEYIGEFPFSIAEDFLADEYTYQLPLLGKDISVDVGKSKTHENNLGQTIVDSEKLEVKIPIFAVNNAHLDFLLTEYQNTNSDLLLLDANPNSYFAAMVKGSTININVLAKGAESSIITITGTVAELAKLNDYLIFYTDDATHANPGNLPQFTDVIFP